MQPIDRRSFLVGAVGGTMIGAGGLGTGRRATAAVNDQLAVAVILRRRGFPTTCSSPSSIPTGRVLAYENRLLTSCGMNSVDSSHVFYGTEGYMVFSRRGFQTAATPATCSRRNTGNPTGCRTRCESARSANRKSDAAAIAPISHGEMIACIRSAFSLQI